VELVKRKSKLFAHRGQTFSPFTVYVDLPGKRRKRLEIVLSRLGFHPGQSVARPHIAGRAHAQPAVSIVNADLRYGVEEESLGRRQSKQLWKDQWNDSRSNPTS